MSMRLLVLGGTVFLSRTVAELAVDRGHDVTVAARGQSGSPPQGTHFVPIDRDDADGLSPLLSHSFDAVLDVGRLPLHVGRALDALAKSCGHWTFVSTGSVYADQATPGQTVETSPLLDASEPNSSDRDLERYGPNKVACEQLVRQRYEERAFVVRPGLVVGPRDPNDRFSYWPCRIAEEGEVLAPGSPDDRVQFVDVRDLAAWILDAAERRLGGTYDAVCPPMRRQSFFDEIAAALRARPRFTWVPQEFLLAHGVNPWAGEESLGLWLPLPSYAGFLSRDPAKSLAAGLQCRDVAATAKDCYASRDSSMQLLANLSREKESAVLTAWRDGRERPDSRAQGA